MDGYKYIYKDNKSLLTGDNQVQYVVFNNDDTTTCYEGDLDTWDGTTAMLTETEYTGNRHGLIYPYLFATADRISTAAYDQEDKSYSYFGAPSEYVVSKWTCYFEDEELVKAIYNETSKTDDSATTITFDFVNVPDIVIPVA